MNDFYPDGKKKVPQNMLKLPKGLQAHPQVSAVEALLATNLTELRPQGRIKLPRWPFGKQMLRALIAVAESRHLAQGLEGAQKNLYRERHGLEALVAKTGQVQNQRLSRFLILANDGSERFYHDAESLILQHVDRVYGCVVETTGEELGKLLIPPQKAAKALMIDDRKTLEQFLLALVGEDDSNGIAETSEPQ